MDNSTVVLDLVPYWNMVVDDSVVVVVVVDVKINDLWVFVETVYCVVVVKINDLWVFVKTVYFVVPHWKQVYV